MPVEMTETQHSKVLELVAAVGVNSLEALEQADIAQVLLAAARKNTQLRDQYFGEASKKARKEIATELGLQVSSDDNAKFTEALKKAIDKPAPTASEPDLEKAKRKLEAELKATFDNQIKGIEEAKAAELSALSQKVETLTNAKRESALTAIIQKAKTGKRVAIDEGAFDKLAATLLNNSVQIEYDSDGNIIGHKLDGKLDYDNGKPISLEDRALLVLSEAKLLQDGVPSVPKPSGSYTPHEGKSDLNENWSKVLG
jgi:phage tail sheath gpL-like